MSNILKTCIVVRGNALYIYELPRTAITTHYMGNCLWREIEKCKFMESFVEISRNFGYSLRIGSIKFLKYEFKVNLFYIFNRRSKKQFYGIAQKIAIFLIN